MFLNVTHKYDLQSNHVGYYWANSLVSQRAQTNLTENETKRKCEQTRASWTLNTTGTWTWHTWSQDTPFALEVYVADRYELTIKSKMGAVWSLHTPSSISQICSTFAFSYQNIKLVSSQLHMTYTQYIAYICVINNCIYLH